MSVKSTTHLIILPIFKTKVASQNVKASYLLF